MEGWIKLSRSLLEHEIWLCEKFSKGQAWVDLLLMANHKDAKIVIGGSMETVKRGSLMTSISKLANRWKWNRRTVRRWLGMCSHDGMASVKTCAGKYTTITIENYEKWQGNTESSAQVSAQVNTQVSAQQSNRSVHSRVHINKNIKNVKNDKKEYILSGKPDDTSQDPMQETYAQPEETTAIDADTSAEDVAGDTRKHEANDGSKVREIVEYLNQQAGTHYKAGAKLTKKKINARLREGYTVDDCKRVVDQKVNDWANDSAMARYIRPETLFGTKFESYLQQENVQPKTDARIAQSEEELEAICQMWE